MIIHEPEISSSNGEIVVSARIESAQGIPNLPKELWFAFPERFESWICDRSDAFLTALIKPAMVLNEPLEVRGIVSPLLAYNIYEYQRIYNSWFPKVLKLIEIEFHDNSLSEIVAQNAVSSCFSGGVDSLFTLRSHLPENQPLVDSRISHLIYIQGVNTPYNNLEVYQKLTQRFSKIAKTFQLELIGARTNARQFSQPGFPWNQMYSAAVIGTPLVLTKRLKIHYVPSSMIYARRYPFDTSPMTDHLLSTETLKIIHHGAKYTRNEKIDMIADWEVAQNYMRVCIAPENCSSCEKCYRTMTMLWVSGHFHKFKVFKQPFRHRDILRWGTEYRTNSYGVSWTMAYIRKKGKWRYIPALTVVYLLGLIRQIAEKLLPGFVKKPIKKLIYPKREWASLVAE